MRSKRLWHQCMIHFHQLPSEFIILVSAILWIIAISYLHTRLNSEQFKRRVIKMGYMPVITNMAAPLLDNASQKRTDIRFNAVKFASFADMAEALRGDQIQAAFIIAPLAIVLHQQDENIRIVLIGNRHESTLVGRKDEGIKRFKDLSGKTVAVPMRYSGHYLSLLQLAEQHNMGGKVKIVEMNPPDMPAAITAKAIDAYYVGEPFAAQALKSGEANLIYHVETVWPDFICNLVIVKENLIEQDPATVTMLVTGAVRAGLWTANHLAEAANIVASYWNQPVSLINYALNTPPHRVVFDQYVPKYKESQLISNLMVRYGLIASPNIEGIIDDRFAKAADTRHITDFESVLNYQN